MDTLHKGDDDDDDDNDRLYSIGWALASSHLYIREL
jgi:hypothetical protein